MRRAGTVARKEFKDILRERTIVLALLTQLFVAAFSAFLTFGLVGLYDPESVQGFPRAEVAYVGPGGFDDYLDGADNVRLRHSDLATAVIAFSDGEIDMVVEEIQNGTEGQRTISLMVPQGEVRTTLLVTQAKSLLREYERDLRVERQDRLTQEIIEVETDAEPNVFFGFAFGVLLPLLVATPVFLAGSISGDAFAQEINTKTLLLLRASPLSALELVVGKLATPVLLAPAQVLLWIMLLRLNDIPVTNVGWLLAATGIWALLLAAAGLLVATMAPKEGHAQAAYTVLILLLAVLSLGLPQDPFNLVARLGAGNPDAATFLSLGITAVLAAATLIAAAWAAGRRFSVTGT